MLTELTVPMKCVKTALWICLNTKSRFLISVDTLWGPRQFRLHTVRVDSIFSWVQVFTYYIGESWEILFWTLIYTLVSKLSWKKIEETQLNKLIVCNIKAVANLRAVQFAKVLFSSQLLRCIGIWSHWVVVFSKVLFEKVLYCTEVNQNI